MADSKKYIGIYNTLEDVQDALDNGQLSKPYVAKTMDNGQLDYNSLSPVDYSQYWCTYYPIDAKIYVKSAGVWGQTQYTGGDGKIPKADFPNFAYAGTCGQGNSTLVKFKYWDDSNTKNMNDFSSAWKGCQSLKEFPMIDTSKGTDFTSAWMSCSSLTEFPALNLSKGVNFNNAWWGCSSLTEFPMVDLSNGTNFSYAWRDCNSLATFPQLDLSNGTNFTNAWFQCSALTTIPQLDLSKGTDFEQTWYNCPALTTLGGFGAISADIDLSSSTKLTVESIMNVINQAATVTGKTMTLGSTNLAKLTDEQKAVATSKGWTLA